MLSEWPVPSHSARYSLSAGMDPIPEFRLRRQLVFLMSPVMEVTEVTLHSALLVSLDPAILH